MLAAVLLRPYLYLSSYRSVFASSISQKIGLSQKSSLSYSFFNIIYSDINEDQGVGELWGCSRALGFCYKKIVDLHCLAVVAWCLVFATE